MVAAFIRFPRAVEIDVPKQRVRLVVRPFDAKAGWRSTTATRSPHRS